MRTAAALSVTLPGVAAAQVPSGTGTDCEMVWSDEFDYAGLPDSSKWRYDVGGHGWGNQERQFYTRNRPENARVEEGLLVIEARREEWEGRGYTSARLLSRTEWTYGRFEARARLPTGTGTWPAIWMVPDLRRYGGWPRAGEIDIMEHVGYDQDVVHASVHTEAYHHSIGTQRTATIEVPGASSEFNLYAVEWEPSQIRAYVNDEHYFTFDNERLVQPDADERHWPFEHPFHYVLNIAVGGTWGGQQGVDEEIWPQRMEVDYVRTFRCGSTPPPPSPAPDSLPPRRSE